MQSIAWDENDTAAWGAGPHRARHALHELDQWSAPQLAEILDTIPRASIHAYTMGRDPEARSTWQRGSIGGLTGADLVQAVETGHLWLNVIGIHSQCDRIARTVDSLYAQIGAATGWTHDELKSTLLISSPSAQVFYHADNQPNALWHLRGKKRVYVYPAGEPFISSDQLDRIAAGQADEQLPYTKELDDSATVIDLAPGDVAWWPQNRPHRVENTSGVNVSLSVEHRTPESTDLERVQMANFYLKHHAGIAPLQVTSAPAVKKPAIAAARVLRRVGRGSSPKGEIPVTFVVDLSAPNCVKALDS